MEKKIKFKGKVYYLIGGDLENGGPIATRYQYEHGLLSYAHLLPDGQVKRFNEVIGTREDVKVIGEATLKVKEDAWDNLLDRMERIMFF